MHRENKNTCEICGRPIEGPVRYRFIDANVKLRVCQNCSRFGKDTSRTLKKSHQTGPKFVPTKKKRMKRVSTRRIRFDEMELIEDFGAEIRKARQKLNLTQDQLGMQIKEPASFIKKIEQEKIHPSINVIKKIEKVLKISLLEKSADKELDFSHVSKKSTVRTQTLEDIITFKKKKNQ
ncbi:MAG: multiprotein bridging factor aMBF1 [Candidatus Helarchaeota archaeon]